jgi:hypothetical protein
MQKAPDGISEALANVTMLNYFALTVTGTNQTHFYRTLLRVLVFK